MLAAMMFAATLIAGDRESPRAPAPPPQDAALTAPATAPDPPAAPRDSLEDCADNVIQALDLEWSEPARGLVLIRRVETRCDIPPGAGGAVAATHAILELKMGRPKAALAALDAYTEGPESPTWAIARWQRLSAYEMLGDLPSYRTERNGLMAASAAAIIADPDHRLVKVDHFETATASVDVFSGRVVERRFIRLIYFVAAPKDGGPIVTLVLELDPQATDENEKLTRYIVNVYSCDGKEFIGSASGPGGAGPPSYESTKALAIKVFAKKGEIKPFAKQTAARICSFSGVMLPGLLGF